MLKNIFHIGAIVVLLASCSSSPKEYSACDCYELMKSKEKSPEGLKKCTEKSNADEEFMQEITKCAATSMGFDADKINISSLPKAPKPGTYTVETAKSKIKWAGRKLAGGHSGNVFIKSGDFTMDEKGLISGGNIVMDMSSITVTDIEDEKSNSDLVGHLMADDFFGVANHPEASFNITSSELMSSSTEAQTNFTVSGDLILKGISKPATAVLVAVQSKNIEGNVSVAGALKFDRTDYGIKYNSGKFYDALGDKVIKDEVLLQITIVAK